MGNPNLLSSTKNGNIEELHLGSHFTLGGEKKTGERTLRNTDYSIINDSFQSLGKLHDQYKKWLWCKGISKCQLLFNTYVHTYYFVGCLLHTRQDTEHFTCFVLTSNTAARELLLLYPLYSSRARTDYKCAQDHKTSKDLNPGHLISKYMLSDTTVYVIFVVA